MWEGVDFNACAKNHVLFASDGSGRSRKTPQTLRQVAFGVATFDMHIGNDTSFTLQETGYLGGQVPGKQTVPRAELWGAIQILSKVDGKSNIQIPIDAKYVTTSGPREAKLETSTNSTLLLVEETTCTRTTFSTLVDELAHQGHLLVQRSAMQSLQCVTEHTSNSDFGAAILVCHGQTPSRSSPNSKTRKDSTSTRQQETRVTFSTILAHATKLPENTTRKNSCIALLWVIATSSAHIVIRNITVCLFLLSRINVATTPILKLPSRVAKVIMF